MQEMNEQYKNCPVQVHEYKVNGKTYRVTSHYIGTRKINDVMREYAETRAMNEMLDVIPSNAT